MPAPGAPTCTRCGGPGTWHAQAGQWGCDRCRMYLVAPPAMQIASPRNNIGLQILGVILVIVIGVIVRLAVRGAFR